MDDGKSQEEEALGAMRALTLVIILIGVFLALAILGVIFVW